MRTGRTLYILSGGKSRRMGHDKALVNMRGETLLNRQIRKAEPFFSEIVVLSGSNLYPVTNRHLPDMIEDAGPLSGLLTALLDGKNLHDKWISILPVDLPRISVSTIEHLSKTVPAPPSKALLINADDDIQPLAGIYSTELANPLQQTLERGNRMVFGFIKTLTYDLYEVPERELKNVNWPDELE